MVCRQMSVWVAGWFALTWLVHLYSIPSCRRLLVIPHSVVPAKVALLQGDAGHIDEDGYVHVMARNDDIINVAGHRISTGNLEEVVLGHPEVVECAVIGVPDELRGYVPVALIVLAAGKAQDAATQIERFPLEQRDRGWGG